MKKTRIRTAQPVPVSRPEAELLVNEIALSENRRRILAAEADEKILAIRESYTPALDQCAADIKVKSSIVKVWADANPEEFAKKKHVEFFSGKVGYRTGTPKLKCRSGWTIARVLETLKTLEWGFAFIRIIEEIAKDELISAINQGRLTEKEQSEIGVRVEQDESFYIEPDLALVQERLTKEAV
jgi:phage host-nuclease inhibitor protein Gam